MPTGGRGPHIEIGRGHDAVFAPRIDHPPLLARSELQGGLVDAAQPLGRLLVGVVEVLVARLSLADTHLQDVAHEQFDLVVGDGVDGVAELLGAREVHPHDGHEGQVVERLADHAVVAMGHLECAARIGRGAVEAAVVVVVGQVVVVVGLLRSLVPTPHEPSHRRRTAKSGKRTRRRILRRARKRYLGSTLIIRGDKDTTLFSNTRYYYGIKSSFQVRLSISRGRFSLDL